MRRSSSSAASPGATAPRPTRGTASNPSRKICIFRAGAAASRTGSAITTARYASRSSRAAAPVRAGSVSALRAPTTVRRSPTRCAGVTVRRTRAFARRLMPAYRSSIAAPARPPGSPSAAASPAWLAPAWPSAWTIRATAATRSGAAATAAASASAARISRVLERSISTRPRRCARACPTPPRPTPARASSARAAPCASRSPTARRPAIPSRKSKRAEERPTPATPTRLALNHRLVRVCRQGRVPPCVVELALRLSADRVGGRCRKVWKTLAP